MPQFRFNHVFFALVLLSFVSAFFLPAQISNRSFGVHRLFVPVVWPVSAAAAWFSGRVSPEQSADTRPDDDIRRENDELRVTVTNLQGQVERLARLSAERAQLGKILELCTVVPVAGADAGNRETLNLMPQAEMALKNAQAVVYPGGLVGRIERNGGMVRLITDRGSRPVTVIFGRVTREPDGQYRFRRVPVNKTLLYGAGNNQLIARQTLSVREIQESGLKTGDWAVLFEDQDFPGALNYLRVAQVTEVRQSLTAPLYADVYLQPLSNLSELREVMVVTK